MRGRSDHTGKGEKSIRRRETRARTSAEPALVGLKRGAGAPAGRLQLVAREAVTLLLGDSGS